MTIKRTSHAVYDTKYHLVWAPKYRRWIVREDLRQRAAELFREIAEDFGFDINEMEVAKDHVHILLDFAPRYSISKVVGILKSISTSRLLREFPELRQHRSREFWEDGYFARTVGDQVTAEVVMRTGTDKDTSLISSYKDLLVKQRSGPSGSFDVARPSRAW